MYACVQDSPAQRSVTGPNFHRLQLPTHSPTNNRCGITKHANSVQSTTASHWQSAVPCASQYCGIPAHIELSRNRQRQLSKTQHHLIMFEGADAVAGRIFTNPGTANEGGPWAKASAETGGRNGGSG